MSVLVRHNEALAPYTTLQTGGVAQHFVTVHTVPELEEAISYVTDTGLPFCVLGGGSNMLVSDEGYRGVVIHMQCRGRVYTQIDDTAYTLAVGAGEVFDDVVAETTHRGLWGLENLSHIPGSVGATPVQNVGAYGVEVAQVIQEVTVFDTVTKKIITLQNNECAFSYRDSVFKEKNNLIIVSVTFRLTAKYNPILVYGDLVAIQAETVTPMHVREKIISIRSQKFPDWNQVGTAGSFFKNPIITRAEAASLSLKYPGIPTYPVDDTHVKVSLGYILDTVCGLKGFRLGNVRLYEQQALVLVAEFGSTTNEIKNFAQVVREKVFEKTSLSIEQEVREI